MLLGLSVFPAAEGVCWLGGFGRPDPQEDPFVGFSAHWPLFVHDPQAGLYRIAPARLKFFAPDAFPAVKWPGTFRIFCLGGSTVQGNPFSKETSFTTWLRLALEQADPSRRWEVVNCGGISYASYRLVPILQECLRYEPDLFILCTGHNEFLEDRTYADLRERSPLLDVPHRSLAQFRTYHVYRRALLSVFGGRTAPPARATLGGEVDALLDYHDGLRAYHRDDAWRAAVMRHYELNLHRMAALCRKAGRPLLLVLPPSNLADAPPFKSEHRPGLPPAERARFDAWMEAARQATAAEPLRAVALLENARTLDPQFAATRFHLGKLYESLGRFEEARTEFLAAREHDICPLRILQPMEDTLRAAARTWSLPLLDAQALLEAKTEHGIADGSVLADHVHPTIQAHQWIACALLEELSKLGIVQPQPGWRQAAQRRFEAHLASLPPLYFLKGQQHLANLRAWAQGRADGPHIRTRAPHRLKVDPAGRDAVR